MSQSGMLATTPRRFPSRHFAIHIMLGSSWALNSILNYLNFWKNENDYNIRIIIFYSFQNHQYYHERFLISEIQEVTVNELAFSHHHQWIVCPCETNNKRSVTWTIAVKARKRVCDLKKKSQSLCHEQGYKEWLEFWRQKIPTPLGLGYDLAVLTSSKKQSFIYSWFDDSIDWGLNIENNVSSVYLWSFSTCEIVDISTYHFCLGYIS